MEGIFNLIAELLFWREDYKFSKLKKERREFEKQNNLPKKIMIHPVWKLLGILIFVGISISFLFSFLGPNLMGEKRTKEKITRIENLLENEINSIGKYPNKLNKIIRNNPMRKNITYDYWNNEFYYKQTENGLKYTLISKGKDGILLTDDDISGNEN